MEPIRLARLLSELDDDRRRGRDVGGRLCDACVDVLTVSGAGIMLMIDGDHQSTLGGSNAVINLVEELQFVLGEGPCIDAVRTSQPVHEPDLRQPAINRWPAFAEPAVAAGVRAVFGFPLHAGRTSLGALDVYLDEPGHLRPAQVTDALIMADVISTTVLALQADAPVGGLADQLDSSLRHRAVVHQATGMVSAQLDLAVHDALLRIRAHAYTSGRPVLEVAHEIVDHRLLLE